MLDKIKESIVPYVLVDDINYYSTIFNKHEVIINRRRKGYNDSRMYIRVRIKEDGFYVQIQTYNDEEILRNKLDSLSGIISRPSSLSIPVGDHVIKFKDLDHFLNKIDSFF